ncbi:hypothetical protein ACQJBY_025063 [Aegilops geniculata]
MEASFSTSEATKGLKETVKWRREYRPDAISWEDLAEMENEARRTHVANYLDKNGRTVLVVNLPMQVLYLWPATLINPLEDIGNKELNPNEEERASTFFPY